MDRHPAGRVPTVVWFLRSRGFTTNPNEAAAGFGGVWVGDRLDDRLSSLERPLLSKKFFRRADAKVAGSHRRATLGLAFRHVRLHLGKTRGATKWRTRLQRRGNIGDGSEITIYLQPVRAVAKRLRLVKSGRSSSASERAWVEQTELPTELPQNELRGRAFQPARPAKGFPARRRGRPKITGLPHLQMKIADAHQT